MAQHRNTLTQPIQQLLFEISHCRSETEIYTILFFTQLCFLETVTTNPPTNYKRTSYWSGQIQALIAEHPNPCTPLPNTQSKQCFTTSITGNCTLKVLISHGPSSQILSAPPNADPFPNYLNLLTFPLSTKYVISLNDWGLRSLHRLNKIDFLFNLCKLQSSALNNNDIYIWCCEVRDIQWPKGDYRQNPLFDLLPKFPGTL